MMRSTTTLLILALSCRTMTAATVIANGWVWKGNADESDEHEHIGGSSASEFSDNSYSNLRGVRSSASGPQQGATQPQHVPDSKQLQETYVQNMLTNQGCPPTSSCGDVCYVLTLAAASDLHSVASGKTNQPSHGWHQPASFWKVGVCNAKAQCVSVNPFDKSHTFHDLASTVAEVERECERSVGMASMFLLAKAMDPAARSCDTGVAYPNALA